MIVHDSSFGINDNKYSHQPCKILLILYKASLLFNLLLYVCRLLDRLFYRRSSIEESFDLSNFTRDVLSIFDSRLF